MKYIDLDKLTPRLRGKIIDSRRKRILISRIGDSKQAKDASTINCEGFGRIRTLDTKGRDGWGKPCVRYRVGYNKLGISPSQAETCQIFQNAACNFRCWFCFVDDILLTGSERNARWFIAGQLVDRYLDLKNRPNILVLSGGQPDLTPEWAPWTLEELDQRSHGGKVFVWMDDNLSGFLSWELLSHSDWERMRRPTFAKLCGLKGIDAQRFSENTSVHPRFYERQFEILSRFINERIEIYIELVLTSADDTDITLSMRKFVDRLSQVHPNLPLRVNPTQIRLYTPTRTRLNPNRLKALQNQYKFNQAWLEELQKRFTSSELQASQHEIKLW